MRIRDVCREVSKSFHGRNWAGMEEWYPTDGGQDKRRAAGRAQAIASQWLSGGRSGEDGAVTARNLNPINVPNGAERSERA